MNALFKYVFTVTAATIVLLPFSSAFGFPWDTAPQNEIPWSDNLRQAQELSRQSGKPVLLHFFSDTCPPCRMMENTTFPNPAIAGTVQNSFIPVKLNVKKSPREAQMFNVHNVPMDIVLTPDGQQIKAALGGQDVKSYSRFLANAQVAAKPYMVKYVADSGQVGTAKIAGGRVAEKPETRTERQDGVNASQTPIEIQNAQIASNAVPVIEAGGVCPINETPSFDYASIPEEDRARIEFEGYCPVELSQHSMWVRGDYNNRLQFEGRLYLFAGKAQLEEFRRNPEKYAPAYQGIDIVVWRERGEKVHGVRNYGAWAIIQGTVGRVFLFSSEENLSKFEKNPRYYLTPNNKQ